MWSTYWNDRKANTEPKEIGKMVIFAKKLSNNWSENYVGSDMGTNFSSQTLTSVV